MRSTPVIISVLRSGGDFKAEHVKRLADQCAEFAPGVPFHCLSDHRSAIGYEPLLYDWPGWWAKIEVFGILGPVLYLDLDTTIVGDLSPLIEQCSLHKFIALRDFNYPVREMGSGLMGWSGDLNWVKKKFMAAPTENMQRCRTSAAWGDQGFIEPLLPDRKYWQDLLPGAVVSYKKHCMGGVPPGARVVCHHGPPRPWEVK
jgi:hypothetical protein